MRRIFPSLLLLLASSTIGVLALEGLARWKLGAPWPEKLPLVRVKPDPNVGWLMLPGDVHFTYDNEVRLNNLGFRGPDVHQKPKKEYRIIALGDSHIYGQGVAEKDLITTIWENGLNKLDHNCSYRVINMGVRAYSINNEMAVLEEIGIPLTPDHVFLFLYLNDFYEIDIEERYARFSGKDWYMFDLSSKPTPEITLKWNMMQLLRKSAFVMAAHDIYNKYNSNNNLENRILQGALDKQTKAGIQFVKNSLERFVRLSKDHHFNITLVAVPASVQAVKDYPDQLYQSTLQQYAQEHSLEFIDLLQVLRRYYEQNGNIPVIPFDGHYGAEGHRLFGEELVNSMSEPKRYSRSKGKIADKLKN